MSHASSFGLSGALPPIGTLTGNIGGAVGPTANNIDIIGAGGITVTGNPGTSTLTITGTATAFTWNEITGASATMSVNQGYIANRATLVTLTLPAVAAVGDVVRVVGKGVGLWKIAQNAGQTIHLGVLDSTTGAAGYIASILQYDCVELLCITANTDFVVMSSVGNITVA